MRQAAYIVAEGVRAGKREREGGAMDGREEWRIRKYGAVARAASRLEQRGRGCGHVGTVKSYLWHRVPADDWHATRGRGS